jgi:hypothetical protein
MASGEEAGTLRLFLKDVQENTTQKVFEFGTALVSQATKTPVGVNVTALPFMGATPYKGKRLVAEFTSAATDIIESEECDWTIPLNYVNERTGKVEYTADVKLEEFTGFKPSGAVDISCTAATPQRIAYIDAPQGYLITLGAGRRYHAYIGDDA